MSKYFVLMLFVPTMGCASVSDYRGANADWSKSSSKSPLEFITCVSDAWGSHTSRLKSLPNAHGQTLVLDGGPAEIPLVDAVVDATTEGLGTTVKYGGRLRGIALPWVEKSVTDCI